MDTATRVQILDENDNQQNWLKPAPIFTLYAHFLNLHLSLHTESLSLSLSLYIYIYMCVCVCVCVCVCTIGPKCCVWKKGVHRKRNTQTRNLRKKNSSFFLFTWVTTVCSSKSSFPAFFLPLPFGGDSGCRGSRLVDTLLSILLWQAGYDGLGSPEFLTHLFRTLPSTGKISLLDF